ncbi:MAG: hypothetical protein NTV65_09780 [Proteobacteria bacterium]|nr:hypothetical protein [Pseudomonadota bacterium]
MFLVKDRYDEVFQIELDGWCFGITNYPGELSPSIIHRIVRELAASLQAAIEHNVAFNILEISEKISIATRGRVHTKEIALAMIAQLPNPAILQEEQQCVLGVIIDTVDREYTGALESFYRRWNLGVKDAA